MTRVEVPAKNFRAICNALGYRRRAVDVVATQSVTLDGLNWCSGSINHYHALDLASNAVKTAEGTSIPHPMNNEMEGARVALRDGRAIIRTGFFAGKVSKMIIYVHPSNMPAMLGVSK